ncbi:AMP-binding enzyme family protein [Paraburkholderia xenovorans LB400]|uniref:Coenzyme F390 synthetase II n=1 Tax=Paraburkholderia xenovorans (strain LB400) TaxID=266265 RepID=Q13GJ5_PARXL|nr:AMP-binding protein [Paraburkholderia xenovorans]ABE36794.1 Putative coenzyme F390 synthetase II [Paraburkholderia xenovorans LB400]AIP34248.1 AMP-binding enzyme family protein [Paraburkholderia xenovorans LB400]
MRQFEGSIPIYHQSLDFDALCREFPPADRYASDTHLWSPDRIHAEQNRRFIAQMDRAWEIPFYQSLWGEAGIERADIRGLEDIDRLPTFSVHDLREALAQTPPWGSLVGLDPLVDAPLPLVFQTSGGTTGLPRPMLYSPRDREVMNILMGRRFYLQGVRPFDLVLVSLALGLTNAGLLAREGLWKYTGAVPIMAGTGAQTPTRRQIELIRGWNVQVICGSPAYYRYMANVAQSEMDFDVRESSVKKIITWLGGESREELESLWNADVYDGYGTNELGTVAAECAEKSGLHVFEDAFHVEILDRQSGTPAASGEPGVLHVTTLFKHLAPMIRFNTNDMFSFHAGDCNCGCKGKRLTGMAGRADNMIKLRGISVFPEAIGELLKAMGDTNGEFVCIVERSATGQDEMQVLFESTASEDARELHAVHAAERLREGVGLKVQATAQPVGSLASITRIDTSTKVVRLVDKRKQDK